MIPYTRSYSLKAIRSLKTPFCISTVNPETGWVKKWHLFIPRVMRVQPYPSGSTVLVWQETVETLDVTGHFLRQSMPLCAFIRLNRFLLIKKEEKEKSGKTVGLWLLRPTKSYLQGSGSWCKCVFKPERIAFLKCFVHRKLRYSIFTMLLNLMPEITQIWRSSKKAAESTIKHCYWRVKGVPFLLFPHLNFHKAMNFKRQKGKLQKTIYTSKQP